LNSQLEPGFKPTEMVSELMRPGNGQSTVTPVTWPPGL
jgi:hypothetical protein